MLDLKEEILDHYKFPRNKGMVEGATHKAAQGNVSCGDKIEFGLVVNEKGVIEGVGWDGEGCSMSMASASMLSEELVGKKLEEIEEWDEKKVFSLVGEVNAGRVKCALLPLVAIKEMTGLKM